MSTSFLARHYNTMTGFPGRITNLAGMIEPWVKEWNVKSALDAGCGGGALMFALDQLGVDVVGLDINEAMLRLALDNAREAGKTFRFSGAPVSSAAEIFPERFDAAFVIGNALVSHETEAEMMVSLRGLHDSIKPGGHILIQNLNFAPFALGSWPRQRSRFTSASQWSKAAKCSATSASSKLYVDHSHSARW